MLPFPNPDFKVNLFIDWAESKESMLGDRTRLSGWFLVRYQTH